MESKASFPSTASDEQLAAAMLHLRELEAVLEWLSPGEKISYDVAINGIVLISPDERHEAHKIATESDGLACPEEKDAEGCVFSHVSMKDTSDGKSNPGESLTPYRAE